MATAVRDQGGDNWSFNIPKDGYIRSIRVASGDVLVSLSFTVQELGGAEKSFKFGGRGGNVVQPEFASNEYITSIAGAYGTWKGAVYVTSLTFNTNLGTYGPFGYDYDRVGGATGVVKFSFQAPDDAKVAGFFGYADSYITRIGFYPKPVHNFIPQVQANVESVIKLGPWGRDHNVDNWSFQIPTGADIKAITIATGAVVDSLIFTVQDASGATVTLKYGGPGGTGAPSQLELAANEYLTSIAGAYGRWKGAVSVTSLTFITNLGTHGPYGYDYDRKYGATGVVKFSFPVLNNAKVAGFYGYADNYIGRIGFYAKPVQPISVISLGPWGRETSSSNGSVDASGNIKEIIVGHGVVIDSLTFTVQDANGHGEKVKFGGNGGSHTKVEFAAGEYITKITGTYGKWLNYNGIYLTAIAFTTNLGTIYGPFGREEDNPHGVTTGTVKFSTPPLENAEIFGFFAYFDNYIQNIGIYIRPKSSAETLSLTY